MKNSFGQSIILTVFGESHGNAVGAVIDGLAPGIPVDSSFIESQLVLRRPSGRTGTARREEDRFEIVSGVFSGMTTGTPLCIMIPNTSAKSSDYESLKDLARPGHADYTSNEKYHGFQDYRGGGHFSGRVTAAVVAAGAVVISALRMKNIKIGTHISRCAGISDRGFSDYKSDIDMLNVTDFAFLDPDAGTMMKDRIESIAAEGDSTGGILETAVIGLPAGLGEPWFDSAESVISHAVLSIPGIKGIQFGDAFDMADAKGSEFNDPFAVSKDGKIVTVTNHNGGINGGITNGMPVVFRSMVKPTPSISRTQETVDFVCRESREISVTGRHDPAIIHRARVVVDSLTAFCLADLISEHFGTDYLGK
ncbi:MAG: chorismate synthase [Clostridia bacterium]|nr:chorismate synthase [Clostridia bacterium]